MFFYVVYVQEYQSRDCATGVDSSEKRL